MSATETTQAVEVSVLMSVFNGEATLRAAVESVLAQEGVSLELLIADDASRDGSSRILAELASRDPRVKLLIQSTNQGLTRNLNALLQRSSGRYIARMDADDLSLPGRFRKQLDWMQAHPSAVACGSSVWMIDAQGERIKLVARPPDLMGKLRRRNAFVHGSLLFRGDVLRELGGYSTEFRYAQDYELLLRLSKRGELGWIDEPLYALRRSQRSISYRKMFPQAAATAEIKARHLGPEAPGLRRSARLAYEYAYSFVWIYKLGLPWVLQRFRR